MRQRSLDLVFLGLSLSSSWGNGHATTYRSLLRALAARGHRVLFLERDQPWYASNRDLEQPGYCRLRFYDDLTELRNYRSAIAAADAVIVGSYVPDGLDVARFVLKSARGTTAFYDIDTPVTLHALKAGNCAYLAPPLIPEFDLYLSFTGGPVLRHLERFYGAQVARALYCSVDPAFHRRTRKRKRWHLGYLGTYSPDRQPVLRRMLIEPARRAPQLRFVVAGPQYPAEIDWPDNVDRIEHVAPAEHADFYSSLRWTLNATRSDMVRLGYSPSVRLFEAAACATPIISDEWVGLDQLLTPDQEIVTARNPEDVLTALSWPPHARRALGLAAQRRVLAEHTAICRARELELYLAEVRDLAPGARVKVMA